MKFKGALGSRLFWVVLPSLFSFSEPSNAIAGRGRDVVDLDNAIKPSEDAFFFHKPSNGASQLPMSSPSLRPDFPSPMTATNVLQELHNALEVMQTEYFALWIGKWTTAIDWTAAVMGTHVSAALYSLSHSVEYTLPGTFDRERKLDVEAQMVENEINKYFAQSTTYFFGEDHFAIRNQAYDDILWVVLGWLDSIKFIKSHSDLHYPPTDWSDGTSDWHGRQFIPAFAHRARVFYELAEKGWDWRLCGGGMTWSPHLLPYKNAITNELFISASISMYLNFPGDANCSPFMSSDPGGRQQADPHQQTERARSTACTASPYEAIYDPIYLVNAINGYDWLKNSGMTNARGLYVDGFHITDYYKNRSKTDCDDRNEMVYTYNQGVLLSGLRGLWEGTGNVTYLIDGHELIGNVVRATGWEDADANAASGRQLHSDEWSGLGSNGILTELCDPYGTCSQNGHTFKGIFFHHLTTFCAPLPRFAVQPGKTYGAAPEVRALHRRSCNEYAPWVMHNGEAALKTKDSKGRFGAWWGASLQDTAKEPPQSPGSLLPEGAHDYRNDPHSGGHLKENTQMHAMTPGGVDASDLNDRGRGRTVETQGGGVAVTRAMWEFLRHYEKDS
ncbi:glycoside hydrolase family 76 protein [Lophiostoma macrostomum CBS 122681]|uniref:Glycoside hydrolase family 76 protein n=1 Tax=Lophiostoma macrostomum CBS 122681 TaxID=1314788 RepID=A0A6A6TTW2_9PLEO|nr:glycoside hydrolase family 76 protein [Lophiostoma macrostomum CBS 122681]